METCNLPSITIPDEKAWNGKKAYKGYIITGRKIERFAMRTDCTSLHGTQRLRDIMRKMGIMHELVRQGIEAGDKIAIAQLGSLEY